MNRFFYVSFLLVIYYQLIGIRTPVDPTLTQLDTTLKSIDSLKGYGPVASLYGLEKYLFLIEDILKAPSISSTNLQRIETLAEKIFSKHAYRDGSQRSRIYLKTQESLWALLNKQLPKYPQGKAFLQTLLMKYPLIGELALE